MTIKVIGAGFGRTGTTSLKQALETVGFSRCYHMSEVPGHAHGAEGWLQAANGKPMDWDSFLQGYQATLDWPACTFYQQLHAAYPQAKIILTVRDPDRWYDSVSETIYPFSFVMPSWLLRVSGNMRAVHDMIHTLIWQGTFHGRFLEPAYAKQVFVEHIDTVKRSLPPEQLLVFDVAEGWQPLCAFLGVPVPAEPFPRVNDAEEMKQKIRLAKNTFKALYALAAVVVVAVGYGVLR